MHHGLMISFIIGGLLMIMVVTLNVRMGQHASELTLHGMSLTSKQDIAAVIEHDFSNMGYKIPSDENVFVGIPDSTEIIFRTHNDDLEKEGKGPIQTITWRLDSTIPAGSNNTEHKTLLRIAEPGLEEEIETTEITLGVTEFELIYFDEYNIEPDNPEDIRRIEIILVTESKEQINYAGGNGYYPRSSWKKSINPQNLKLR